MPSGRAGSMGVNDTPSEAFASRMGKQDADPVTVAEFLPGVPYRASDYIPSSFVLVSLYTDLGARSIHGVLLNETSVI